MSPIAANKPSPTPQPKPAENEVEAATPRRLPNSTAQADPQSETATTTPRQTMANFSAADVKRLREPPAPE